MLPTSSRWLDARQQWCAVISWSPTCCEEHWMRRMVGDGGNLAGVKRKKKCALACVRIVN